MLLPTVNGQPVLLPGHNDLELDQPIYHYHLDPRFVDSDKPSIIPVSDGEVVFMEFPDDKAEPKELNFGISFYLQLLQAYEGRKLCGTRCPHRGVEVFHNGQCMGHGLRFDNDSVVKGRLRDSYLWLPGSKNRTNHGKFDQIYITEYMPKVTEVWLMSEGDVFLAKNKIGPFAARVKDVIKLAFHANEKLITVPEPCPPDMSDTRETLALRLAPITGEVV